MYSQSYDEYVKRGNEYRSKEQYEKAIIEYNNALKVNSRHADAFFERGIVKAYLNDMAGAVQDVKEGLNLNPSVDKYYLLAVYQQYLPDSGMDILFSLNKAIELNSVEKALDDSELYAFRGRVQSNRFENFESALEDYTTAIEHASAYEIGALYEERAQIKKLIMDYNGALMDFNKAIDAIPLYKKEAFSSNIIHSNTYYQRGALHMKLNNYRFAIIDFTTAIQYSPQTHLYFSRAKAKHSHFDYKGALADYDKYMSINSNNADAYFQRGNVKMDIKDYTGAIRDFTKSIDIEKDSYTYANRGLAKEYMDDFRGAINDYNQAVSIDSDKAIFYSFRAGAKLSMKDYVGAIQDFDIAIKKDAEYSYSYEYRGLAKIRLGRINEGCLDLSRAGELGSKSAYDLIKKYCR